MDYFILFKLYKIHANIWGTKIKIIIWSMNNLRLRFLGLIY